MTVWLNGTLTPTEEAQIAVSDRGFLLGDGLFETILLIDGHPVFLEQHLSRLVMSAEATGIECTLTEETVLSAVKGLIQTHDLAKGHGSLRISISRGPGPRGLLPPEKHEPVILMSIAKVKSGSDNPLRTHISDVTRNEGSPVSQMKTLSYMDNIMARQSAASAGFDEAIMLNNAGHCSCATIGNLFWISPAGDLLTPAIEDGVLPGIVRAEILTIAVEKDLTVEEGALLPDNLSSGLIFMTNSLMGLRLLEVEGVAPDEVCLPLFKELSAAYDAVVRQYVSDAG